MKVIIPFLPKKSYLLMLHKSCHYYEVELKTVQSCSAPEDLQLLRLGATVEKIVSY